MEREDLTEAFTKYQGDMDQVMNAVPFSSVADIDNFVSIIKQLDLHNQKKFKKNFKKSVKNLAARMEQQEEKFRGEAEEAEQAKAELGLKKSDLNSEDDLRALILKKQKKANESGGFMDYLASKYATGEAKTKGKSKSKSKSKSKKNSEKEAGKSRSKSKATKARAGIKKRKRAASPDISEEVSNNDININDVSLICSECI